LEDSI